MYTGHIVTGPDKERDYKQSQKLPYLRTESIFRSRKQSSHRIRMQIPAEVSQKDFRDPKVFMRDGITMPS